MAWEDKVEGLLGACVSPSMFGSSMIHHPAADGAESKTFNGIWSAVYLDIEPDSGIQVLADDPNVGARLSDFDVDPKKGDEIEYKGDRYTIRAPEPDGEGGIVLVLEKAIGK